MNKIFTILIIAIIVYVGYQIFFIKDANLANTATISSFSELAKSKNASLDKYESIIKTYEDKGGLKTQSDMLQFSSEMQNWSSNWVGDMSGLSKTEIDFIQKRLQSLTSRQMKLIKR